MKTSEIQVKYRLYTVAQKSVNRASFYPLLH
jgi:hypothetical protein